MHFGQAVALSVLITLACPLAGKATTLNEVKVATRVVDFVATPPRGQTSLAVFYDGQNRISADDAKAILGWLTSGAAAARVEFVPTLVDLRHTREIRPFSVAVVADGTDAFFDRIFSYAQRNHTLTLSSDMGCVRADRCAVGVTGTPRVEVVISHQAADACGIVFSEAFRMMVTEN